ncbi:MAG: DUF2283 domain-containing protein [Pseudohongiellaceae bacterium]
MKLSYFNDTDTLYIELNDDVVSETKELDENTILDYDASGNIVAITMEHASSRTDISRLQLSGLAA